jgi:hypothetical protein
MPLLKFYIFFQSNIISQCRIYSGHFVELYMNKIIHLKAIIEQKNKVSKSTCFYWYKEVFQNNSDSKIALLKYSLAKAKEKILS